MEATAVPAHPHRRVVAGGLAALALLAVVDVTTGVVLVSTLGIVVVVVGLLAPPRQVLVVGGSALLLAALLAATVDRDRVAPLRVGNVAIGTAVAYGGAAARVRRERRLAELEERDRTAAEVAARHRLRLRVLEEEHRRVTTRLQEALVPALPRLPGTGLDLAFLPADPAEPSGGDLHDVHRLPDGAVLLVVVDVVGHGLRSTRDALRLVHLARALVLSGVPLPELWATVDRLVTPGPDGEEVLATAVAARYDPRTGEVLVADAGHPPPLLVRADGGCRWVEAEGRPVGYPLAGSDGTVTAQVDPGDLLLLYTDGLVEAERDVTVGLDRLARTARALRTRPLAGWSHRLVDRVLGSAPRRDDVLVLALRRDTEGSRTTG